MASPDLPLWAWNLIIAVQNHEEQHGSSDRCLNGILAAIPAEVRSQAEAINAYVRQAQGNDIADKAASRWDEIMASFFPKPQAEPEAKAAP